MGKNQGAVKNSRDFTFHEENLFRPVVTRALVSSLFLEKFNAKTHSISKSPNLYGI